MKNYNLIILLKLVILFAFSTAAAPAADNQQTISIVDHGTDGDERYYTVNCPNGKQTTLVKHFKIGEVCTQLSNSGRGICKDWSVDEAAIEVCKIEN